MSDPHRPRARPRPLVSSSRPHAHACRLHWRGALLFHGTVRVGLGPHLARRLLISSGSLVSFFFKWRHCLRWPVRTCWQQRRRCSSPVCCTHVALPTPQTSLTINNAIMPCPSIQCPLKTSFPVFCCRFFFYFNISKQTPHLLSVHVFSKTHQLHT